MPLNEAETRAKLIDPAIHARGWTEDLIRREESAGAVEIVEGRARKRSKGRVDYTLRVKVTPEAQPVALALIEAKPESLPPGHGLEQAKAYATSKRLNVPFVLSTNGHLFVLYDRFSGLTTPPRPMAEFPTPAELRAAYFDGVPLWKGTVQDDLHGHYRLSTHSLETTAVPEEDSPPADAGQVPDNSEFDR